jgi:hypothetical protein
MRSRCAPPATAKQEPGYGFGFPRRQRDAGENLFDEVGCPSLKDPHHHVVDEAANSDLFRLRSEVNIVVSVEGLANQTFSFQLLKDGQHRSVGAGFSIRHPLKDIMDGGFPDGPQNGQCLKLKVGWTCSFHATGLANSVDRPEIIPAHCYYELSSAVKEIFYILKLFLQPDIIKQRSSLMMNHHVQSLFRTC